MLGPSRTRVFALSLSLAALGACSLRPHAFGESASEATSTGAASTSTSAGSSTSAASTSTSATGDGTTGEPTSGVTSASSLATSTGSSDSFILMPDFGDHLPACGPWRMTCPEGQKCMPYSGDGDSSWESWGCFDLVPDPAGIDEPCMVIGSGVSGEDTCDAGLMCWNVDWDTGVGTCFAMCSGTPEAPICPEPSSCTIAADAALILCLPPCDPLAQDCAGGDLCLPNPQDPSRFICVLDASGEEGQAFDVCEYENACDPGLLCLGPESAVECDPMALGCCAPMCDTSAPNTCPGVGQACVALYEEGMAPLGFENIGFCSAAKP